MKSIRPISDLRNHFAEVSKSIHESSEPMFFTKNGYADMVVMSMEAFEKLQFESEVYYKLSEAEKEEALTNKRYDSKEILDSIKAKLGEADV
jgi:PHD/YefM family antitoxin component YafN of YafNO toxin-antitoxin module